MYKKYFALLSVFVMLAFVAAFGQNTTLQLPSNGSYKVFYRNGLIKEKGQYNNTQKKGIWYFYNENGVLEKKEKYKNGTLLWQIFYEKGRITKTIDKNGKVTERSKCGC